MIAETTPCHADPTRYDCGAIFSSSILLVLVICSGGGKRDENLMNRGKEILELSDKVQRDLKLAGLPIDGGTTDGTFYSTIHAMWTAELELGRPPSSSVSIIVSFTC